MDITKLVRKNCQDFAPYIAGKPIEEIKRELKLRQVVKLASNENNLGPSPLAVRAIKKNAPKVYAYPDSNSFALKQVLAKKYDIPANSIFTAAGGDEIIEILGKLFFSPGDEIIISKHSFIRYEMAVKLMDAKAVVVPMADGFVQNLDAMLAKCSPKTKAIFITNPNNPTGTYNDCAAFENFLQNVPVSQDGQSPLIILDEAYFEYAAMMPDYPNGLDYIRRYKNLIVFRTFSKAYALAGMRVGYGFANPEIVDYIERIRPPFNVNSLASAAACASLTDKNQVKRTQKLIKAEKNYLYKKFEKLDIDFIDTAANFIMFSVPNLMGKELFKMLLEKGVIIRSLDEYELREWARVSIGLHSENKFFIKKLKEVIRK
ncbi:MAG: histidinol-phosphate transaminase [Elusimicrobiota bacterium]|jgi:histidinol-phosphate aminotransferase|nr:histidinol-phosphate transaminase [Elusimicrobiota bacterium]